jgi:hypothetical protein
MKVITPKITAHAPRSTNTHQFFERNSSIVASLVIHHHLEFPDPVAILCDRATARARRPDQDCDAWAASTDATHAVSFFA